MTASNLLEVRELTVEFRTRHGRVEAVRNVSLSVKPGETVGIVGESGSGKSVTSYAVMRILDRAGRIADGSITFSGIALHDASEQTMRDLRGREISMIFQNPRAALNPIRPVGRQIEDVLTQHVQATRVDAKAKAIELLQLVRIADAEQRYHAYPFELSGGMCQRIVFAMALACRPRLLIADEPTTGLDVTTQKAVMDLVVDLAKARKLATILITHDLGLAAQYCDRIVVMEQGTVVEIAPSERIFRSPTHPYTQRLVLATPRPGISVRDLMPEPAVRDGAAGSAVHDVPAVSDTQPILEVENLVKEFPRTTGPSALFARWRDAEEAGQSAFRAVDAISFSIAAGECVGLVGEVGLREIDDIVDDHAPDRSHLRRHQVRGHRYCAISVEGVRHASVAFADADGVPGSHRQPQSALHGLPRHRRSALPVGWRLASRRGSRACRGTGDQGRPARRAARSLSPSAVGRAEGACRHRPRDRP